MIDVRESRELSAILLARSRISSEVNKEINAATRRELGDAWKPALARRAVTSLEKRIILPGAKARVHNQGFSMQAATSRRALPNGLVPSEDWAGAEFGARSKRVDVQVRGQRGTFTRKTIVNRQFKGRQKHGRIAFDAASELGTKLVATWVRATVDVLRDVFER
jgi:hypothetical protein